MSRPLKTEHDPLARVRRGLSGLWLVVIVTAGCFDSNRSNSEAMSLPKSEPRTSAADDADLINEPYHVEVTGHDYRWHVRYLNSTDRTETEKDWLPVRNIHVPLDTDVVFVLKSEDYVYVLDLPEFGKKEIAVPSLEFRMQFHPEKTGQFPLLGDELCGDPHPELKGTLVVEPKAQFLAWLQEQNREVSTEATH